MENVSCLLRLRSQGSPKPNTLQRVKAHAICVSITAFVLCVLLKREISENKNQSGRFNVYVCLIFLQPIGIISFVGSTLFFVFLTEQVGMSACIQHYEYQLLIVLLPD